MGIKQKIKSLLPGAGLEPPITCRHQEYSIIASLDDDPAGPSERLLDISLATVGHARTMDLSEVSAHLSGPPYWPDVWPGEHYKLLAGLMLAVQPELVVEIGTFTGLSALSMLKTLPTGSRIVTYDIFDWQTIADTCLQKEDFSDGRLEQRIADLADPRIFAEQAGLLQKADLFFIDGPKDIAFEQAFLHNLAGLEFARRPLLIFDDIRVWNMLRIWRGIDRPKLDLTSFGHWSGTGLVDWC